MSFEKVTDPVDLLGECPLLDGDALLWVDGLRRLVKRWADGRLTIRELPEVVGSIALADADDLVVALENRVVRLGGNGALDTLCAVSLEDNHRLNDGAVDPWGQFVFGSMNEDRDRPSAALYRLGADGRATILHGGMVLSNGLDWSPSGDRLYFTDSVSRTIFAADYRPDGPLGDIRVFAEWKGEGMPDGLAVDESGSVWSAVWDGACLVRYSPDGRMLARQDLPVVRPTSIALGDGAVWLTSARVGLSEEELNRSPLSGSVLKLHVDVRGIPTRRCAGHEEERAWESN